MTAREIAAATDKPERTVRDWVKALAAESAVVAAKLAASSPTHPADYTLDETCQIIAQGLGEAAAAVYRENALRAEPRPPVASPRLRLPNGAQLRALSHIYPAADLARRLDFLIGYAPAPLEGPVYIPGPEEPVGVIDRAIMEAGFRALGVAGQLSPVDFADARRAAIAAGARVLDSRAAKLIADGKQPRLGL